MHLVLTGSADVLVLSWHFCLYFSMVAFYVLRFGRTELTSGVGVSGEDVEAVFEVVEEVSEGCVSVYSLNWLTDFLPTVSRLQGGEAAISSARKERLPLPISICESLNLVYISLY